jgi:hypothetical protein
MKRLVFVVAIVVSATVAIAAPPTIAELQEIYGYASPQAYIQAQRQVEEENALRAETLRQQRLANDYEAQNNALKLENQRLRNEALQGKNAALRQPLNNGAPLNAQQREKALAASDEEIIGMARYAASLSTNPDPAQRARGERLSQIARMAADIRRQKP